MQSQIELFTTLKKTEVLHKYEVEFTVRPKNNNKVIKKNENYWGNKKEIFKHT